MICKYCWTENLEGAVQCVMCDKPLVEENEPKSEPVRESVYSQRDFSLASSASIGGKRRYPGSLVGKTVTFSMAIGLVFFISTIFIFRGVGTVDKKAGVPVTGNPEAVNNIKQSSQNEGTPSPAGGPGASYVGAIQAAADVQRIANAKRLQMVLDQVLAESEVLPPTLDEIPEGMIDFNPDPAIYNYIRSPEGRGYRLEVTLKNPQAKSDDPHMQNGKYVLISEN